MEVVLPENNNNNYVRFFRLVREKATYLQACVLLRYFNDVRARALARIVKAYAPRGGSQYPAEDLMNALAFETVDSLKSFISHYGLRVAKNTDEMSIILNRNQFIEDSDPYPISRAMNLIESKRQKTVGEVIAGGNIPRYNYTKTNLYSSFNDDGRLKETALLAEDLDYNTINDSNKDLKSLKNELQKLSQGGKSFLQENIFVQGKNEIKKNIFVKPNSSPRKDINIIPSKEKKPDDSFSFQPAIPIVADWNNSDFTGDDTKNIFTFSKPKEMEIEKKSLLAPNLFGNKTQYPSMSNQLVSENKGIFSNVTNSVQNVFNKPVTPSTLFKQVTNQNHEGKSTSQLPVISDQKNVFANANMNLFLKKDESSNVKNVFGTKSIFAQPDGNKLYSKTPDSLGTNVFGKPLQDNENKQPSAIFGSFGKPSIFTFAKKSDTDTIQNSITPPTSNGEMFNKISPGSLFKSVNNPNLTEPPAYTIFQSKNKSPTASDNMFNSVNVEKNALYEFPGTTVDNNYDAEKQLLVEFKKEEERRQQEKATRDEKERLEALKRQEDEKRKEERRKLEEHRKLEEQRKKEEEMRQKQEELKKKLEAERKAEEKRKTEEKLRVFNERVERESEEIINEIISEVRDETVQDILSEEIEKRNKLFSYAEEVNNEICSEIIDEICHSELKAEIFRTNKVMKKWFHIWRGHFVRNYKRRNLLDSTPIWLSENTPPEKALLLRRLSETVALKGMYQFHRGYKFKGELKIIPPPQRYNIIDIMRSPFLKRMRQIQYPYDKCFFWKLTLISPGAKEMIYRKINVENWLLDSFSDRKKYEISDSLIYVGKQSWNNLIEFAISVSLMSIYKSNSEALEGSNGLILYVTEKINEVTKKLEEAIKFKYQYQILPVAIIITSQNAQQNKLEQKLISYKNSNSISDFKFFIVNQNHLADSLNFSTKRAIKWLAKRCPKPPALETDYLKSICERYLGNEIWYKLKTEMGDRRGSKNLQELATCYNRALDKLTELITDEDLFLHPTFPLEFKQFLNNTSPYPKPFEFIASNIRNSDNNNRIKWFMEKLKLPLPMFSFLPEDITDMQSQMRKYCKQIGWFETPEEVTCKVVALFPNEFSETDMPCDKFRQFYENYNLIDFLNVIVYEKIRSLDSFGNVYAMYSKSALQEYRQINWHHCVKLYSINHECLEYKDEIDYFIEAKRRKIANDSLEYLMLENKDKTMVEETIKDAETTITSFNSCKNSVTALEQQLIEEQKKSNELENLLRLALSS